MLTSAHHTTMKAQEITSSDDGELMVAKQTCLAAYVNMTTLLEIGASRLIGVVLNANQDAAEIQIDSPPGTCVFRLRAIAGTSRSVFLPAPCLMPESPEISLTGTLADALIYYAAPK